MTAVKKAISFSERQDAYRSEKHQEKTSITLQPA